MEGRDGLIEKFAQRFIAIGRNKDKWHKIKDDVVDTFDLDADDEKRIFEISDLCKYSKSRKK